MSRTAKKTKRKPRPFLETVYALETDAAATDRLEGSKLVVLETKRPTDKADAVAADVERAVVDYFQEELRETLLKEELPMPLRKFNGLGSIAYEVIIGRISERERLVSYYEHQTTTRAHRPKTADPEGSLSRQFIFTLGRAESEGQNAAGGSTDALAIIDSRPVPSEHDWLYVDLGLERIPEPLEEEVRLAVLKDEPFQELCRYYFDGSLERRATISRISEHERLVSYYSYSPSPRVRRKLAKEAHERRKRGVSVHLPDSSPKREQVAPRRSLRELVEYYKSQRSPG